MNIVALMPTNLKGVFDSIIKIGRLVEKEKEAEKLILSMKDKFDEIENRFNNSKKQRCNL